MMEFPQEAYEYYENKSTLRKAYSYVMDRRYRKAVQVAPWLKPQVTNASKEMKALSKSIIKNGRTDDAKMIAILKWVKYNIRYSGDHKRYTVNEVWSTAEEVLTKWWARKSKDKLVLKHEGWTKPSGKSYFRSDDCESGACVIYVLARLAGVPSYKLRLMCGSVEGGGHCWVQYRPQPHWSVYIDWCYWSTSKSVATRPKFFTAGKTIKGDDARYKTMWFAFNEDNTVVYYNLK